METRGCQVFCPISKKWNRPKILSYGDVGINIKTYIVLDAAARGGTCACASKVVYTPTDISSRDDRPSISTQKQRTVNPLRVGQGQ